MNPPKPVYFLSILILVGAIVGSYFAFIRDNHRRTSLKNEAPAEVINT